MNATMLTRARHAVPALCAAMATAGAWALPGRAAAAEAAKAQGAPPNTWVKVAEDKTAGRTGAVLLAVPPAQKMLHFGGPPPAGAPYVQAFDPAGRAWSEFSPAAPPAKRGIHVYYQAACDPQGKRLYCLSDGSMYTFDLAAGKWHAHGPIAALSGMSWPALAIDPKARRLVVIGADKRPAGLGWTRTVILDLDSGKWAPLPAPPAAAVREHSELVAATEAIVDLVGRTRMAWYRDPQGSGTDAELREIASRCDAARKMPGMGGLADEFDKLTGLLAGRKTLEALRAARALRRQVELLAERQWPVPPARRNSPLVFDAANEVFVLFGGDHEDYLTNDTWVLDLSGPGWRRARPALAPSPRAGHAMAHLPGSGRIALYEGYVQSNDNWYGTRPWKTLEPRQLWVYDVKADRWDLLGAWRTQRGDTSLPAAAGGFYGYSSQYFSPPALAADGGGRLVLAAAGPGRGAGETWVLRPDPSRPDLARREKLGRAPDQRLYRTERFLAAYCEVPDKPRPAGLESLPANRWVKLPPSPRNVAYGCRQRDWGTAVWDGDNDQILLWGGGHCVRSASCPIHYCPMSGRMVEGYDADEPYSANGGGGYGSSLLNRPWVGPHAYNTYAYDPKAKVLVTATGFRYDPRRMDWLRGGPTKRPFRYVWSATVMEGTPRGAVVWAQAAEGDRIGLWIFRGAEGWGDLKPVGKLYGPYCDSEGMTYDLKRDRLLLGWGGGYMKAGDGSMTAFDFGSRKLEKITPAHSELGRVRNTREMVYLDHADWVLFAEPYVHGDEKTGKRYLRVYDCGGNRYWLLDAGPGPRDSVHSQGWCYDAGRKLVYVITYRGDAYALRIEPNGADLVEAP